MRRDTTDTRSPAQRLALLLAALGLLIPAGGTLAGCTEEVPEGEIVNEEGGEGGEGGEGEGGEEDD